MSRKVFANGKGVSAKKDDNKSICALPNVCLSPPSPPAGPVPLPHPNTAKAADTSDGSKTVKIGGAEVGMKNSSNYKKSTGDEAATRTLGMGVVTHTIQGKMKHAAWSFDVKIEGANAIRHMDMTTHNHMNCDDIALTINEELEELADQGPLTCNQLTAGNLEAQNEELEGLPDGHAVVTAHRVDAAGNGFYLKAVSNQGSILEPFEDGYAQQPPTNNMPDCQGGRTGRATNQRRYDAENKMLDQEMALGGGGTILMSTWHRPGLPAGQTYGPLAPHDAGPCYGCRQAICDADTFPSPPGCGIEVYLCPSDGGPPVRPRTAGLCPPAPGQGDYDQNWQAQGLGPWY